MRKIVISRHLTRSPSISIHHYQPMPVHPHPIRQFDCVHPCTLKYNFETVLAHIWMENDDYKMYLRLVSLARSFASPLHFGRRKTELLIRNEQRNSFNWSSDFPFVLFSCARCPWIYLNVFHKSFALHFCFCNILEYTRTRGHKKCQSTKSNANAFRFKWVTSEYCNHSNYKFNTL